MNNFKDMSKQDLQAELRRLKETSMNLRFQKVYQQMKSTQPIKEVRRNIARVLTFLNQKAKE